MGSLCYFVVIWLIFGTNLKYTVSPTSSPTYSNPVVLITSWENIQKMELWSKRSSIFYLYWIRFATLLFSSYEKTLKNGNINRIIVLLFHNRNPAGISFRTRESYLLFTWKVRFTWNAFPIEFYPDLKIFELGHNWRAFQNAGLHPLLYPVQPIIAPFFQKFSLFWVERYFLNIIPWMYCPSPSMKVLSPPKTSKIVLLSLFFL